MESEFRKDIVSGDWVLIAGARGRRPHAVESHEHLVQSKQECPFEEGWEEAGAIQVIKNKFPAVSPGLCTPIIEREGYQIAAGIGYHELILFRDHDKFFPDFSDDEMAAVVCSYRDRYRAISAEDDCAQYIMIFHNYGREAGASVYHPHTQVISLPILPPDVARSLRGSARYHREHGREAHEVMIAHELTDGKRIVYENEKFVAFCPYVSKQPYEVRIYPRDASAYFDRITDADAAFLGDAMRGVLRKFRKALADPAYNFFIHTAPIKSDLPSGHYEACYRWHVELYPRIKLDAGFEAGTGIKINMIDPDYATEILNKKI